MYAGVNPLGGITHQCWVSEGALSELFPVAREDTDTALLVGVVNDDVAPVR